LQSVPPPWRLSFCHLKLCGSGSREHCTLLNQIPSAYRTAFLVYPRSIVSKQQQLRTKIYHPKNPVLNAHIYILALLLRYKSRTAQLPTTPVMVMMTMPSKEAQVRTTVPSDPMTTGFLTTTHSFTTSLAATTTTVTTI
jgi:hypothetical protein